MSVVFARNRNVQADDADVTTVAEHDMERTALCDVGVVGEAGPEGLPVVMVAGNDRERRLQFREDHSGVFIFDCHTLIDDVTAQDD